MKTKLLIALLSLAVLISGACSSSNHSGNHSMNSNSHAGMNHNPGNSSMNTAKHQGADHPGMDHSQMKSSPGAASAPYDLQFIDTMIAHHQGAVEMARPAADKAAHPELKTLAQNIVKDQEKEIANMREWREKWFAGKAPAINMEMTGMSDSMKGMDMKKLESLTGNDFDLEFIKQMMPHHEGAVMMAREALQKSEHEEIKKLSRAIIEAQEKEIKQMKDWQSAWSG